MKTETYILRLNPIHVKVNPTLHESGIELAKAEFRKELFHLFHIGSYEILGDSEKLLLENTQFGYDIHEILEDGNERTIIAELLEKKI